MTFPCRVYGPSTANDLISGAASQLRLRFQAKDVYAVLGGHGTLDVSLDGRKVASLRVQGYPRNYTIIKGSHLTTGLLQVNMSPGISAYDFTFG